MKANQFTTLKQDKNGFAGVALTVAGLVALLIGILVGVLVFYKINASIATGTTASAAVHTQLNTTMQTVFTLLPIAAIIIVAGIMIALVTRFGTGGV